MNFIEYIKKISLSFQANSTKAYLILTDMILVVFAIWFSNVGILPFAKTGDFLFFIFLCLILAIYRPGWTFVLFIGTLALENINLAPRSFGLAIRPYQFLGALTAIALVVQMSMKRLPFSLPKWKWYDALPIIFAAAGFLSSLGAASKGMSFKQSAVAATFVVLYFLVRIYVQSFEDLQRIAPFFISSGLVVSAYGIWQNFRFLHGGDPFEVMPGRPNGTFTEADWFGIYLVFLLAVIYTLIYMIGIERSKKQEAIGKIQNTRYNNQIISNNQISNSECLFFSDCRLRFVWNLSLVSCSLFLVILFVALILTVSRSAWIGAVIVTLVFLKFILLGNFFEYSRGINSKWKRFILLLRLDMWQWKKAGKQLLIIVIILGISIGISSKLTRFQLAGRVESTGGLQKITIACTQGASVPEKISNVSELGQYGCRHINLEDIEKEKNAGNFVTETYRPDPNVNVRSEIYKKSIAQIKAHPVFGIGWGSISTILGTDDRGAGLNASNIFLEVWLGSGILGFLSFAILLLYIMIRGMIMFLDRKTENKAIAAFVFLGWAAVIFPNLFNSGIFLGFVWAYLGVVVSLLAEKK